MLFYRIPNQSSNRSQLCKGSALMEYVVPSAILLLTAGLLTTLTDINTLMGEYFVTSSGYSKSDIQNNTFKLGSAISSTHFQPGNGMQSFSSYGSFSNANPTGSSTGSNSANRFYWGAVTRSGGRLASTSAETLY